MDDNIKQISIEELEKGRDDNDSKVVALKNNPFLNEMACSKLEYFIEDKVVGSVYTIPLQIVANDIVFGACAGSTLLVDSGYRGRGIAKQLTLKRLTLSKDKIAIASGLSGMSLPLFKKLGFTVFTYPRMIFINHSRAVLEPYIHGFLLKILSIIIDTFLLLFHKLLKFFSVWTKKSLFIQEANDSFDEIERMVALDKHSFRENHNKDWFSWHINNSFSNNERSEQRIYVIKQHSEAIGFFMTKTRFYEKASHRGFKNVLLGSVIEWGVKPGSLLSEKQVCKAAILSFDNEVDAVEICTENKDIKRALSRLGMVQVGESNFAINTLPGSSFKRFESDYKDINKWRIRPAMSDNGLS